MRRWSLRILIAVVVIVILAIVITQAVLSTDVPQRIVLAQVQKQLGLRMDAKSVKTGWFGTTDLKEVTLSLPLAKESFLTMPTLEVGHTWLPWLLITQKVEIKSLELKDAALVVQQDEAGRWNIQDVLELLARTGGKQQAANTDGTPARPSRPKLPKVVLTSGTVTVTDRRGRAATLAPLEFSGLPDGPLVWRYDAAIGSMMKAVGQLAPGSTWQHQVEFTVTDAGPALKPWTNNRLPTIATSGTWDGEVQQGQVVGRLNLKEFKAADVTVSGVVNARAGGGAAVVSPRAMFVKTPYKLVPDLRLASGTLRLDGNAIKAERVEVAVLGGNALADGQYSMADNSADVTAVWEEITLPGNIVHRGRIEASMRTPFPDQPVVKATVASSGSVKDGAWDVLAKLDGSGRSWRDLDWTFVAQRLAWDGPPKPYQLNELTAHLTTRGPLLTLVDLKLPEEGRASGGGFVNFAEKQWALKLSGRGLDVPKLHDVPVDFSADAAGNFRRYTLNDLFLRGGELQVNAKGFYDRAIPKPLDLNVVVRAVQGGAVPPQDKLITGDLRAEARLTGEAYPRDIFVEGKIHGEQFRLRDRLIGDCAIDISGNVTADEAKITSKELDLLGGKWSMIATWLARDPSVNDDNLRIRINVRDLPLSQIGEAFGKPGVEGGLEGGWTFDVPDLDRRRAYGSGTFDARMIRVDQFRAQSAKGTITLKDGRLVADPVELKQEAGVAKATVAVALSDLKRPTVTIDAADWPFTIPDTETTLKIAAKSPKLDVDLGGKTVAGQIAAQAAVTAGRRSLGQARVDAQVAGHAMRVTSFGMEGFGGRAEGSAQIDLDAPLKSTMDLTWREIDAAAVGELHPALNGLTGRFGGSARLAPATDPRALEPLRADIVIDSYDGAFRAMQVGDATITAFLNYDASGRLTTAAAAQPAAAVQPAAGAAPTPAPPPVPWSQRFRVVLSDTQDDPSLIRIADGIVRVWGRVGRHAGGEVFPAFEVNLDRLDLDPIVHAIDPRHKPIPGRVSGTIRLFGTPHEKERMFGTGHLVITDSDIGNLPLFSRLYDAMRLNFDASRLTGQGECDIFLEASRLTIGNLRYFNRGVDARARVEILDFWKFGDSPIYGSAVGSLRPFKNLKLPFMADVDEVLNVLQSNVTSVVLEGTLKNQKTRPVPFSELSGAMKSFLLGDVRAETRGGSGR